MLTQKQKEIATSWYIKHYSYVNSMLDKMDDKTIMYPPSDSEDKNNPTLWKAVHWNWYLNKGTNQPHTTKIKN